MKILTIGNSFSEDSTKYLYAIAKSDGRELKVVNLYIGGCCLELHWNNVLENKADYDYQLNGVSSDKVVSILDTLLEDNWDVITIQQCSGLSGLIGSYRPYSRLLSEYIKKYTPNAKLYMHQTWAYEIDSIHEQFINYHSSQSEMFQALLHCYQTIASELALDIIPFGQVIQALRKIPLFDYAKGGISLCRDGFHMHEVYGRYALAATWYMNIVGGDLLANQFIPPVIEGISAAPSEIMQIKQCIMSSDYIGLTK